MPVLWQPTHHTDFLIVGVPLFDPLVTAALDIVSVIVGMFVFETLFYKTQAELSNGMTNTTASTSGISRAIDDRRVSGHFGISD
jgi:hypothetical protein